MELANGTDGGGTWAADEAVTKMAAVVGSEMVGGCLSLFSMVEENGMIVGWEDGTELVPPLATVAVKATGQ